MSPENRRLYARAALAELCRRSLYEFLKASWSVLEPGVPFEDNWHVYVMCQHVQNMLESWLVANGHGTRAMRQRVMDSWAAHGLDYRHGQLLVQNLVINLPPITLKSRILMVCAPAWMWLHCPSWSVGAISSVDDNVKRDSNYHRDLVTSPWYVETFLRNHSRTDQVIGGIRTKPGEVAWEVRRNIDAVGEWMTTAGGERKSRTLLGNFTGVHVDALLLDDPDDAHKVHSESKRKEVQFKWSRAIKNRVKHPDRSIRIAIQQRVHTDDWTAAQVAKGVWSPDDRKAWAWMVIPLQYGRSPKDAPAMTPWLWSDPRQVANDNLQPGRFSDEFIADEIRDKGPEGFEGQYNQNPESYDNGMIRRSYIRLFRHRDEPLTTRPRPHGVGVNEQSGEREEPFVLGRDVRGELELDCIDVSVDASFGSENPTASATSIIVGGCKGTQRFVLDDRSRVMGIEDMYDEVEKAAADWGAGTILIEIKANGAAVIAEMKRRIRAGNIKDKDGNIRIVEVVAYDPKRDSKESRAAAMRPTWSQNLVYVHDGAEWLYPRVIAGGRVVDQGFVNEICSFPGGKKNDRVDAMSQWIAFRSANGDARSRWAALSRIPSFMVR